MNLFEYSTRTSQNFDFGQNGSLPKKINFFFVNLHFRGVKVKNIKIIIKKFSFDHNICISKKVQSFRRNFSQRL